MSPHGHHHGGITVTAAPGTRRFALVGSPNSGKTTLFNALTHLRAKTGNYPGVTVAKYEGRASLGTSSVVIEDLPGTYGLEAISPDEAIVQAVLDRTDDEHDHPDGIILTADALSLQRSLNVVAHVLAVDVPTVVVLTFTDELRRRGGAVDAKALGRALGVPVLSVTAGDQPGVVDLKRLLSDPDAWPRPVVTPPLVPSEFETWSASVLSSASYVAPGRDLRTNRIDAVLLHPVAGTVIFFGLMFVFFQALFTGAAPFMDAIETFFGWLGGVVAQHVPGVVGRFLSEAIIGGVGGVVVFVPQIVMLFLMISLLESVGYMSRAALLMDRVMGAFGLEGRAFVAMLSSLACAIPGIMATRSLPSARDRIATMMGAPLMTCSARLPVYTMLIAMLVPERRIGPVGMQGLVMFGLYVFGACAAMLTASLFGRFAGHKHQRLPFYMEMPPYRLPSLRTIGFAVWSPPRCSCARSGRSFWSPPSPCGSRSTSRCTPRPT